MGSEPETTMDGLEAGSGTDDVKGSNEEVKPMIRRSESMAHAYTSHSPASDMAARIQFIMRQNARAVAAAAAFVFLLLLVLDDGEVGPVSVNLRGGRAFDHWGGAFHTGYFSSQSAIVDDHTFKFAAVTDLDELSKVTDSKKALFKSVLVPGTIKRDDSTGKYTIQFDESRTLLSKHNEGGRGMELSELTLYKNRLLSFDDRTGDVFELLSSEDGSKTYVVPRFVITEGGGDTDKGMKWEWATVKNNELYIGSMGKEYTNPDGSVDNTNNLWIAKINDRGELQRIDWVKQYNFVRAALGASSPGYIINEAVLWSDHLKKWVFLPRRISTEAYDENKDEKKGSNKLCMVDDKFTVSEVVEIGMGDKDPLHGFSTFAFVPNTHDEHALAIRSVEEDCTDGPEKCKQRSYFVIFNVLTGEVLMDEVKIDVDMKFEGIEFVDIATKAPKYED